GAARRPAGGAGPGPAGTADAAGPRRPGPGPPPFTGERHPLFLCATLANLAHNGGTSVEPVELTVSQARDHFSDAVNRAAFGGEITYVTRGRGRERAAAIVPAERVEGDEARRDRGGG